MPSSVEEFRPQGAAEQPLYSGADRRVWERCRVTAHFAPGTDVVAALECAAAWTGRSEPLRYQACRARQPILGVAMLGRYSAAHGFPLPSGLARLAT